MRGRRNSLLLVSRGTLFSFLASPPRAMQSRRAVPFFPPPLDVRKRRAGLRNDAAAYASMNPIPSKRSTCSENVEFPLSRFCPQKSSRQERNRPKGCSSEKDARTKSRQKRKTRKGYLGGGGGCQTSAKERLAFSEKNTREDKTELQFFSFLEFRVLRRDLSP